MSLKESKKFKGIWNSSKKTEKCERKDQKNPKNSKRRVVKKINEFETIWKILRESESIEKIWENLRFFQILSFSLRVFFSISLDSFWFSLLHFSDFLELFQILSKIPSDILEILLEFFTFHIVWDSFNFFQIISDPCRLFQILPNSSRFFEIFLGSLKFLQGIWENLEEPSKI